MKYLLTESNCPWDNRYNDIKLFSTEEDRDSWVNTELFNGKDYKELLEAEPERNSALLGWEEDAVIEIVWKGNKTDLYKKNTLIVQNKLEQVMFYIITEKESLGNNQKFRLTVEPNIALNRIGILENLENIKLIKGHSPIENYMNYEFDNGDYKTTKIERLSREGVVAVADGYIMAFERTSESTPNLNIILGDAMNTVLPYTVKIAPLTNAQVPILEWETIIEINSQTTENTLDDNTISIPIDRALIENTANLRIDLETTWESYTNKIKAEIETDLLLAGQRVLYVFDNGGGEKAVAGQDYDLGFISYRDSIITKPKYGWGRDIVLAYVTYENGNIIIEEPKNSDDLEGCYISFYLNASNDPLSLANQIAWWGKKPDGKPGPIIQASGEEAFIKEATKNKWGDRIPDYIFENLKTWTKLIEKGTLSGEYDEWKNQPLINYITDTMANANVLNIKATTFSPVNKLLTNLKATQYDKYGGIIVELLNINYADNSIEEGNRYVVEFDIKSHLELLKGNLRVKLKIENTKSFEIPIQFIYPVSPTRARIEFVHKAIPTPTEMSERIEFIKDGVVNTFDGENSWSNEQDAFIPQNELAQYKANNPVQSKLDVLRPWANPVNYLKVPSTLLGPAMATGGVLADRANMRMKPETFEGNGDLYTQLLLNHEGNNFVLESIEFMGKEWESTLQGLYREGLQYNTPIFVEKFEDIKRDTFNFIQTDNFKEAYIGNDMSKNELDIFAEAFSQGVRVWHTGYKNYSKDFENNGDYFETL